VVVPGIISKVNKPGVEVVPLSKVRTIELVPRVLGRRKEGNWIWEAGELRSYINGRNEVDVQGSCHGKRRLLMRGYYSISWLDPNIMF
jgi:hypothetical protein